MPPFIASWGIIGAGWVASTFAKDLALSRPEEDDVKHSIAAVCALDRARAQEAIDAFLPAGASAQQAGVRPAPVACEGVDELLAREDVSIVYIATLSSSHFALTKRALEAGKHVLTCPPATATAGEWTELCELASSRNLFLMESFHTMFNPVVRALAGRLERRELGTIEHISQIFCQRKWDVVLSPGRIVGWVEPGPAKLPKYAQGRAPAGPVFDIGAYILMWSRMVAAVQGPAAIQVQAAAFSHKLSKTTRLRDGFYTDAHISLNCGARSHSVEVVGERGRASLHHEVCTYHTLSGSQGAAGNAAVWEPNTEVLEWPHEGWCGLNLEADAVARDLRDGRLENDLVSHAYTAETIRIFESVHAQGAYLLPANLAQPGRRGVHAGTEWHADWMEEEEE